MSAEACLARSLDAIDAALIFIGSNLAQAYKLQTDPAVLSTLAKGFRRIVAAAASATLRHPFRGQDIQRNMTAAAGGRPPQLVGRSASEAWAVTSASEARAKLLEILELRRTPKGERRAVVAGFERAAGAVARAAAGLSFETVRLIECLRLARSDAVRLRASSLATNHHIALHLVHPLTLRTLRIYGCAHGKGDTGDDADDEPSLS